MVLYQVDSAIQFLNDWGQAVDVTKRKYINLK